MAVPAATRQYPKNDSLAQAWDLLNWSLEIAHGNQVYYPVSDVESVVDFPTNSAIWQARAAEMRGFNGLAIAQFVGYRDPQLHPRLDSLRDNVCLEVDQNTIWNERNYDLIHSRVIGHIEKWPEFLANVQACLASGGELIIEVVEIIPSTDDDSLPETYPLLKLSRILYEPSETPEEQLGHVFSNIGRDLNKIGMQPKITHYKLPVKHHG
ncbi:hypothetical protein BDP55DRAFT_638185 [Colletotrichum godetiae]|uniref:Methyltransferase n=1 Tax=Colletotrichum godetiae TaxID=1209918 RepID=A0AAJ0EN11_9PEZI|nr:uncharacterized protein BDP55DRAFT_638185 [Colletotrichum godetiae]KAK1658081.1 hypothetical protein BDP55DRAFT_638185 [Colletotrichum godetiae]